MPALGPTASCPFHVPHHPHLDAGASLLATGGRARSGASVPCGCVEGTSLCGGSWLPVISFIFSCCFSLTVFTGSVESKHLPSDFHEPTTEDIFTPPNILEMLVLTVHRAGNTWFPWTDLQHRGSGPGRIGPSISPVSWPCPPGGTSGMGRGLSFYLSFLHSLDSVGS